jgi:hypothetical protein
VVGAADAIVGATTDPTTRRRARAVVTTAKREIKPELEI